MAYVSRAAACSNKGQWDLAIADCTEAIELDPNLAEPYYNRGLAYKEQGKKAEAVVDFEKFITLTNDPDWVQMVRRQIEELSK